MLYALLAAASTASPTATPIPPLFPDMWNFVEVNFIDILGLLFTLGLGIAAFVVSRSANKLAKQQQRLEEEMRKRENKIAVNDKAFSIYCFFNYEIAESDYFSKNGLEKKNLRIRDIKYLTEFLFRDEIQKPIIQATKEVWVGLNQGTFPELPDTDDVKTFLVSMSKEHRKREYFIRTTKKNINKLFEEYKLNL